ncbi:cytochrome c/FTR1 family iron permease [Comamonas sp. GB3 AK4-5]|uniref:cytochrome c/FTR1 family iron permease n=1 Tax=Comamonas sp. GB3 AK4-5 TaxID=3231487 RepID=UPI00351F711C
MRFKLWWAAALLWCAFTGQAMAQTSPSGNEPDARQLWQLLDYVAVDYGGAVEDGKITSESEYEEMLDFTANAIKQIEVLPEHADKARVAGVIAQLRSAVEKKESGDDVARLAHQAADMLVAAYPIPVAPTFVPELSKGAALYQQLCASCHGATGGGDGPAAKGLDPEPIAFNDAERANARSLMALYQVASQGVEGTSMVSYATLPEEDRWALAFFIGSMSHDDAMRAQGEQLWKNDAALRARFPDMAALTTATTAALSQHIAPETARDVLAYLRTQPSVITAGKPTGVALSRLRLAESLAALKAEDRNQAMKLALSAYLDGFEPLEPTIAARNKQLMISVESAMIAYRGTISKGSVAEAEAAAQQLEDLFRQVDEELGNGASDATATFVGALTILLREGLEALLIVVGMIALLRKAGRPDALRYVHAGWSSALVAGGLTWAAATYLVEISGASREVTEGLGSVIAALVLLSVGLWMHSKSSAGRWQAYLSEKLHGAMGQGSMWGLFLLAFISVYREVFETVLFFSALASDGHHSALLGGGLTAAALLTVIAWVLLRTSARMPIGKFFSATSILVAVLAVVLVGKGMSSLQEAGWVDATPVAFTRMELLGVYPTLETLLAQAVVLVILIAGFAYNRSVARREAVAATEV